MIARVAKPAVWEIVPIELSIMFNTSLEENLRTSFYEGQNGIRSGAYNVTKQKIMELLRKDITGVTLDA